jgi:hypothetical protein
MDSLSDQSINKNLTIAASFKISSKCIDLRLLDLKPCSNCAKYWSLDIDPSQVHNSHSRIPATESGCVLDVRANRRCTLAQMLLSCSTPLALWIFTPS